MSKISEDKLNKIHKYWLAANYLSVGQIYLQNNPLLRTPLKPEHIKPRLLGHWGTTPGLNLIYVHLNRIIKEQDVNIIYITGPGHGGPAVIANVYLEGTYSEIYPEVSQDTEGMLRLFKQFSYPGGVPSHVSPHTPGSINEGGELGYALLHAFGAVFDNPDLIAACVIGDGEAETGPLAASWKSNMFLNPARDGAVLPILHLNGYKISGPTVLGRKSNEELNYLFKGLGYNPYFIEGDNPHLVHRIMAETLETIYEDIQVIKKNARSNGFTKRPIWPMIILRTPKGWTGPKEVDGLQVEGTFRSHQVPLPNVRENPEHLKMLEAWMQSYKPQELFTEKGKLIPGLAELVPKGDRRMGANPNANGGKLLHELDLPDFKEYAFQVTEPGKQIAEATKQLGKYFKNVFEKNEKNKNFRIFCPDETNSNRLGDVFDVTDRCFMGNIIEGDDHLSPDGRVLEVLSEHCCQGWLEGYLLTGRHGLFPCYEAFITIVDSMVNQHAKWLKTCKELPWRKPISSLNYLLTSHAWRQDHNGYSHQGPGFINTIIQKKSSVSRIYLPPDGNCLLSVMDHCLQSLDYVNLVICGKQPELQWLDMKSAIEHCQRRASIWQWASNDKSDKPDIVMACAGDVPTMETLAAVWLLKNNMPQLNVRAVNVVDLMSLLPHNEHPHGLDEVSFGELFTNHIPVIFAFHGYPRVIHELIYKRPEDERFHVHGYIEEGTTTTPFDMTVCNSMSRYHLAIDALQRVPRLHSQSGRLVQKFEEKLQEHQNHIRQFGEDMPEIRNWKWS